MRDSDCTSDSSKARAPTEFAEPCRVVPLHDGARKPAIFARPYHAERRQSLRDYNGLLGRRCPACFLGAGCSRTDRNMRAGRPRPREIAVLTLCALRRAQRVHLFPSLLNRARLAAPATVRVGSNGGRNTALSSGLHGPRMSPRPVRRRSGSLARWATIQVTREWRSTRSLHKQTSDLHGGFVRWLLRRDLERRTALIALRTAADTAGAEDISRRVDRHACDRPVALRLAVREGV